MTSIKSELREQRGDDPSSLAPRRIIPAVAWAIFGAVMLALIVYMFAAWIFSSDFRPTPVGSIPVPEWVRLNSYAQQILIPIVAIVFVVKFLILPWRREGHMTFDGMMIVAALLLFWQDVTGNYFQPIYSYNAVFVNMGSWSSKIPGWVSPNGHMFPEPLLFTLPLYIVSNFGVPKLACSLMVRFRARWPRLGPVGVIGLVLAVVIALDFVIEIGWLRLDFYAYGSGGSAATLFSGTRFGLPWWEFVLFPLALTGLAALRYYRNDKGESFAERGVDSIPLSFKKRQFIRFLSLVGATNALYLGLVMIPQAYIGMHSAPWPAAVVNTPYRNDGICGVGTDYVCPNSKFPIQMEGRDHISFKDGSLTRSDSHSSDNDSTVGLVVVALFVLGAGALLYRRGPDQRAGLSVNTRHAPDR
jgi:Spirocyclase AveC-like